MHDEHLDAEALHRLIEERGSPTTEPLLAETLSDAPNPLPAETHGEAPDPALAHVAGCPKCRATLYALLRIRGAAAALPDQVEPARDLWPGIANRIQARGAGRDARPHVSPRRGPAPRRDGAGPSRPMPGWVPSLAAAATVALLFAGALVWSGEGGRGTGSDPGQVALDPVAATSDMPANAQLAASMQDLDEAYGPVLAELWSLLDSRELSPETRATLEENLGVIDRAIVESRAAVASDPGAARAVHNLHRMYDAKVDMLRMVALSN